MELADILAMPGIVIRKIPTDRTYHYLTSDEGVASHKARGGETFINEKGREVLTEHKTFSMGGKYLITFEFSQDSMVRFSLKNSGVGDTIEQAYENFHKKGGVAA